MRSLTSLSVCFGQIALSVVAAMERVAAEYVVPRASTRFRGSVLSRVAFSQSAIVTQPTHHSCVKIARSWTTANMAILPVMMKMTMMTGTQTMR